LDVLRHRRRDRPGRSEERGKECGAAHGGPSGGYFFGTVSV
jgi:hypothetical protein